MSAFLTVVLSIVRTLLYAINIAMLLRAILSWLPIDEDNRLLVALCMLTEPLIHPIRVFLDRFDSIRHSPFDIAFIVTSTLVLMALLIVG